MSYWYYNYLGLLGWLKMEDRKMQDQLLGWKMQEQIRRIQHVQPLANAEGGFRRLVPTFSGYRGFVRMDSLNVAAKFQVRSVTRSWDNWGNSKNWAVPGYAHTPFSLNF